MGENDSDGLDSDRSWAHSPHQAHGFKDIETLVIDNNAFSTVRMLGHAGGGSGLIIQNHKKDSKMFLGGSGLIIQDSKMFLLIWMGMANGA